MAPFHIHLGSTEPIYRQLMEQIRRAVASGQMAAGAEVPSVRDVAQALAVNPMTVSKAYSLLELEGLLERRRGHPMVVAAQHHAAQPADSRLELLRPTLARAAAEAQQLQLAPKAVLDLFKTLLTQESKS